MAEHIMAFDPNTIPSVFVDPVTGKAPDMGGDPKRAAKQPICIPCRERVNPLRIYGWARPVAVS